MAKPLRSLPLFPGESPPPPLPGSSPLGLHQGLHQRAWRNQLWLAVHMPTLPLEALSVPRAGPATVVVEPRKGHLWVIVANEKALAQGVAPGLKLSAALALSRTLTVLDRSPEAEHLKLTSLAQWARRVTPSVSLEPPHALLLEVRGSLKLWGGIDPIKGALKEACQYRRITAHFCAAPTALAALWLARHQQEDALSHDELVGRLRGLPVGVTGWPDSAQQLLGKMGIKTIGDCLRLPRGGLARRVGLRYLQDLDKSLGQHDLRPEFEPAQRLSSTLEFQDEVTEPEILANAGQELIRKLVKALQKRQAQVASLEFGFHHLRKPKTIERINLVAPTYEAERISRLFLGKLETVSLPDPVIALSLTTGTIEPIAGLNTTLFQSRAPAAVRAAMGELIERLRLRFGAEDIYGVAPVEEHRPEQAWSKSLDPLRRHGPGPANAPQSPPRPLWILPTPVRLSSTVEGGPQYGDRSALRLESGPERIEAGWWQGRDISRDYYIASGSKGEKLWIYRDRCSDRSWFLHGLFG